MTDAEAISRKLLRDLGVRARGRFAAIDTRTGRSYLGDSTLAAVEEGLRADPAGRFFIQRLGYPVAATLRRTEGVGDADEFQRLARGHCAAA